MTSSSPYVRPKARLLQNLAFGIGVLKSEFVFCRSGAHLSQPARVGLSLPASCRSTQHDLRWYLRAKYDKEPPSRGTLLRNSVDRVHQDCYGRGYPWLKRTGTGVQRG
jgi:hypothetical protein